MKFIVIRISNWIKDKKPCEEAHKEQVAAIETEDKIIIPKEWVIEINDLEDLIKFIDKYGDIVIHKSDYQEIPYEIEIYDDYRE